MSKHSRHSPHLQTFMDRWYAWNLRHQRFYSGNVIQVPPRDFFVQWCVFPLVWWQQNPFAKFQTNKTWLASITFTGRRHWYIYTACARMCCERRHLAAYLHVGHSQLSCFADNFCDSKKAQVVPVLQRPQLCYPRLVRGAIRKASSFRHCHHCNAGKYLTTDW